MSRDSHNGSSLFEMGDSSGTNRRRPARWGRHREPAGRLRNCFSCAHAKSAAFAAHRAWSYYRRSRRHRHRSNWRGRSQQHRGDNLKPREQSRRHPPGQYDDGRRKRRRRRRVNSYGGRRAQRSRRSQCQKGSQSHPRSTRVRRLQRETEGELRRRGHRPPCAGRSPAYVR